MSSNSEAGADGEQPLDFEQLPSPTTLGDNVAIDKPYSLLIVCIASCAANFSPLTANIYFPAIPVIAKDFHKSVELINLTVTMHMVMQGISPMFWGTLSDRWGRRPMMFACLVIPFLSCVGLALVPTSAYWLLMLLRCLQATGSASTVALGAGIIGDITTPDERGGFFGLFNLGALVGPSLGPVIGGALTQGLGWRSIFWFLCISSAVCSLGLFLIQRTPATKTFKNPLVMFIYPEVYVLLFFNGTIYAVMYGVTARLSVSFERVYPYLSQTDIGLCFLAMGGGLLVGSKDPSFPIEKARLQMLPWVVFVYTACVIGYGWALQSKVTIAVPLILQFMIGVGALTLLNATQTLLVDMMPNQGSSITACNNLVRCSLAAGMVSIINPILDALGDRWTYVVLGGLCVLVSPLLYVEMRWGPFWRERRQRAHQ
ncbi:major facilitator superfamily domain-containing protein [Russula vinacea]|nr:major facilitator superfamily domain-containing protein [Russula vinacea]